ncbi:MAG: hypothetical protein LBU32_22415, partial [Clostridiales bacterium]|nr:hypothetical protein [Clostridiales bacterium]
MKFLKKFSALALMAVSLMLTAVPAFAAQATVTDFQGFAKALMDPSVTYIDVVQSIKFTKNTSGIPNRDLTINGHADEGVVIDSD